MWNSINSQQAPQLLDSRVHLIDDLAAPPPRTADYTATCHPSWALRLPVQLRQLADGRPCYDARLLGAERKTSNRRSARRESQRLTVTLPR